jgi:hypothetical protein
MRGITKDMSVAEIVRRFPQARRVFDQYGLAGCGGEHGPAESLEFFAAMHQVNSEQLLRDLNVDLEHPAPGDYVYRETLADFIYRRFFKAGMVMMLSIGGFWGAVILLQIAWRRDFLDTKLVPAIHAHAHVMIFGWVGLFVMGFAYQSFPRFKLTTLWQPALANLTFYLMLSGIITRIAAEMLQPSSAGLIFGIISAAAEFAAIGLFVLIILKTGQQSMAPHQPYEKFIFGALFWFLVQAIFSDVFFFAQATAASQQQLIMRIALLDGPLRDVQLLGFATLIIAGVSQRFVPAVYGLGHPPRDRQNLIFWLINGSLVLDVACYLAFFTTGRPLLGAGLELSFVLMWIWAVLLALQLRVFHRPETADRSFKFIRAAYVWLLISMTMLPFLLIYGALTHQGFSHSFLGSYRHAFTVGFVSLMILGVASRVVPILAGVNAEGLSPLWGPFILVNAGCTGRVLLQILSDFVPRLAYALVGITGFIEIAGFAWWVIDLWATMNQGKTHRPAVLAGPAALAGRHP